LTFQKDDIFTVVILKIVMGDEIFHNFPINFSLLVTNEEDNQTLDIRSGKVFVNMLYTNKKKNLKFSLKNLET